jgi:gamma-butyrobetaine dioxygenase
MLDRLAALYADRGGAQYDGEAVTQLEHGLQAAALAEAEGAGDAFIAAALLHDVGHLLGADDRSPHETLADAALAGFPQAVTAPVRLHVAAKRYLCAVDDGYLLSLSPASVRSLHRQGGPMTEAECREFEAHPHFAAAVRLRRWDDRAKTPGLATPPFAHFLPALERCRAAG